MFFAKENKLAQLGRGLRPVIWLVRVAMPNEARRLDLAIVRCAGLAQVQQLRKAEREQSRKAYERWHTDFIKRPLADREKEASTLAQPKLEKAKNDIQLPDVSSAAEILRRGYAALAIERPADIALVKPWLGKEESLVVEVYAHSKGEPNSLDADQYKAAVRVGRVGQLLAVARGRAQDRSSRCVRRRETRGRPTRRSVARLGHTTSIIAREPRCTGACEIATTGRQSPRGRPSKRQRRLDTQRGRRSQLHATTEPRNRPGQVSQAISRRPPDLRQPEAVMTEQRKRVHLLPLLHLLCMLGWRCGGARTSSKKAPADCFSTTTKMPEPGVSMHDSLTRSFLIWSTVH